MPRRILLFAAFFCLLAGGARAARVVAVGDIHGEIDGFDEVLRAAKLVDAGGRWVGGDAVLVQTGDVTDRGPRVKAVMDRLRALEKEAPSQGGRVVAMLGNHEFSVFAHLFDESSTPIEVYHQTWADFAGPKAERRQKRAYNQWYRWQQTYPGCVKPENRAWAANRTSWLEDHPPGFVEFIRAMSPEGEYGAWLRRLPVAAMVDGTMFVHGGISPQLLEQGFDSVEKINQAARTALEQLDLDRRRLVADDVIVPFSTLWETHCAVFVEMARLEEDGTPRSLARWEELAEINARLPATLGWFPTEEHGPLWYRGLAIDEEAELEGHVAVLLDTFGARRIAVGHTPQPGEIRARFAGRVFLIDTAMAYPELGGRPAALEILDAEVTAIYPDERVALATPPTAGNGESGSPVEGTNGHDQPPVEGTNGHDQPPVEGTNGHDQPPAATETESVREDGDTDGPGVEAPTVGGPGPENEQVWLGADGEPLPFRTVEEVLDFLATAKVIGSSRVDTGVTLPRKLLLERDGVRAHAIFHDVAIEKRREQLRGGRVVLFFRDHYANNVAAFELSRMLGMTNVPPAVVRRIGRNKGSVQLWIENSRTEAERRQLGVEPPGSWRLTAKDMQVFDNLANNIDRNQGNILYDSSWSLWFIDHTRSFGRLEELPAPNRVRRCSRRLLEALRNLNEEELRQRLSPYLGIYEIRGILGRRDKLLELLDRTAAINGEAAVYFDYDQATVEAMAGGEDLQVPEAPPGAGAYEN